MCAHKDAAFVEATKMKAEQTDALEFVVSTPGAHQETDASDPSTEVGLHRSSSQGNFAAETHETPEMHLSQPDAPGSSTAGASGLHGGAEHAEGSAAGSGQFEHHAVAGGHTEDHEGSSRGQGFSDRHRNGSAVSLCSLAGSDVSICSMTYVTELPHVSSLFYQGPHQAEDP